MRQSTNHQFERQEQANQIIAQLKTCAPAILAQFPVEIAYVHGSAARGQMLPDSDIDIAVVLSHVPPAYEQILLEFDIQAALEDGCPLSNFDVRTINHAPIMAQGPIVQEGILIFARNQEQRIDFEVLVRSKYFDYLPTAKRMQSAFLKYIRTKGLSGGFHKNRHVDPQQLA